MCWRQVSKLQKSVLLVSFYLVIYILISYAITPDTQISFVAEELRVGDKYVYVFIVAMPASLPVFSDVQGAEVFRTRGCGQCFVTNNKGFLPLSEYDAVLVFGENKMYSEEVAFMDPGKRFRLDTTKQCLRSFLKCTPEPRVISISSKESYDLCGLCNSLLKKRL